eukprot:3279244-Amphidinium_carterae.1
MVEEMCSNRPRFPCPGESVHGVSEEGAHEIWHKGVREEKVSVFRNDILMYDPGRIQVSEAAGSKCQVGVGTCAYMSGRPEKSMPECLQHSGCHTHDLGSPSAYGGRPLTRMPRDRASLLAKPTE